MDRPVNNTAEILHTLINSGSVSIMEFPYLSGFRTRISELNKEGLALRKVTISNKNKYGNTYAYVRHYLLDEKKELANKIYNNICTKRKK